MSEGKYPWCEGKGEGGKLGGIPLQRFDPKSAEDTV